VKSVGTEGANHFGKTGYNGPCPPRGAGAHRYFFKLYALDVAMLNLQQGAARITVEQAMQGHILDQGQLMGRYERR
jgi:Raf kinase inhibitor-like YbhB/YbcL family protein